MKGILQASAFYILMMGVSAGLMSLVSLQHMRYMSQMILKQAMQESIRELSSLPVNERENHLMSVLSETINIRMIRDEHYELLVYGFIPDPLALRVVLNVYPNGVDDNTSYRFEESLIEVQS